MIRPFVVFALPRSRTAWLSRFLGYSPRRCGHDISIECRSINDFIGALESGELDGTVESGAILGWRVIRSRLPRAKLVTVRRPLGEVYASLAKFGLHPFPGELETKDALLDALESVPGVERFDYGALNDRATCARLFCHCLEVEFDEAWWSGWNRTIVQIDMQARLDRLQQNFGQLQAMKVELAEMLEKAPCLGMN